MSATYPIAYLVDAVIEPPENVNSYNLAVVVIATELDTAITAPVVPFQITILALPEVE